MIELVINFLAYSRHKDIGRLDLYARSDVYESYLYIYVKPGAQRHSMLPP